MANYDKGVLGAFHGKVGTVIGSSWKGINYLKSLNRKSKKPPTARQLQQQVKFSLVQGFLMTLSPILSTGFKDFTQKMSGMNSAFRYNYKNAITGLYPAYVLDYTKVLVTRGQLHNAVSPAVQAAGGGIVKFTWQDNAGIAGANAGDKSILVLYCPELKRSVYTMEGPARSTESATIDAGVFTGKTVETWIAFLTEDAVDVASSIYTGPVVVS